MLIQSAQATELVAIVTGQDLEQDAAGVFKIARWVAPARLSAVDAWRGHKLGPLTRSSSSRLILQS